MANTDTTVDIPTNVGIITMISTVRRNRPKGLKRPFDYALTIGQVKAFGDEINTFISQFCDLPFPSETQKVDYPSRPEQDQVFRSEYSLWKPRVYLNIHDKLHSGVSVHVSIETSSFVITQRQWQTICNGLQVLLTKHLGTDAKLFSDGYLEHIRDPEYYQTHENENYLKHYGAKPTTACHRLYTRFDTEIMFEEMIPLQNAAKTAFKSFSSK